MVTKWRGRGSEPWADSLQQLPRRRLRPGQNGQPGMEAQGTGKQGIGHGEHNEELSIGTPIFNPRAGEPATTRGIESNLPLAFDEVEAVRERHPEQIPPKWDLALLLTRAHTRASTVKSNGLLKTRYAKAEQFNVCFDGVTVQKQAVEKEVQKNIDVNEVVAFMREAKYCTELISRR